MITQIILILLIISISDIIFKRIANWLSILFFLQTITFVLWYGQYDNILGSVIGLLIFISAYLFTRDSIGEGDVKLIPGLGLCLGFPGVLYLISGASIASGIVFLLYKKNKAQVLPFAPFLSIAFCLVLILQSCSF